MGVDRRYTLIPKLFYSEYTLYTSSRCDGTYRGVWLNYELGAVAHKKRGERSELLGAAGALFARRAQFLCVAGL